MTTELDPGEASSLDQARHRIKLLELERRDICSALEIPPDCSDLPERARFWTRCSNRASEQQLKIRASLIAAGFSCDGSWPNGSEVAVKAPSASFAPWAEAEGVAAACNELTRARETIAALLAIVPVPVPREGALPNVVARVQALQDRAVAAEALRTEVCRASDYPCTGPDSRDEGLLVRIRSYRGHAGEAVHRMLQIGEAIDRAGASTDPDTVVCIDRLSDSRKLLAGQVEAVDAALDAAGAKDGSPMPVRIQGLALRLAHAEESLRLVDVALVNPDGSIAPVVMSRPDRISQLRNERVAEGTHRLAAEGRLESLARSVWTAAGKLLVEGEIPVIGSWVGGRPPERDVARLALAAVQDMRTNLNFAEAAERVAAKNAADAKQALSNVAKERDAQRETIAQLEKQCADAVAEQAAEMSGQTESAAKGIERRLYYLELLVASLAGRP